MWNKINLFNFNIFFEQELFYELTVLKSKPITYLFEEIWGDNAYIGFGNFYQVPHKRTYLHLLGFFKRNQPVCNALEVYVMKYYPEIYNYFSIFFNESENLYLTNEKVIELTKNFENELRNNTFLLENHLVKRNFFNEGLSKKIHDLIENSQEFWIVKLVNINIVEESQENELRKFLKIEEVNSPPNYLELDSIDEIMLDELSKPIIHSDFIERMKTYLDDDDSKIEFLGLINNRLIDFAIKKVISIYN